MSLDSKNQIVEATDHVAEIVLTSGYPRQAPQCKMLSSIFHPNIDAASICIGDHWAASESLDDLVVRIAEIVCEEMALDGEVNASWKGGRSPEGDLTFEAEVASVSDVVRVDKRTVRRMLAKLPALQTSIPIPGADRLLPNPLRTLERKYRDEEMVPFDTLRVTSRYAEGHVVNRVSMENKHFRIVLDVGVDWPVVLEFLKIRQEALAGM